MDVVNLQGIKYRGRFEGELKDAGRETFPCVEYPDTEYQTQTYQFEGCGKIERIGNFLDSGEHLFNFATNSSRRSDRGLRSCILDLVGGQSSYIDIDTIQGREIFLHCIYQHLRDIRKKDSETITLALVHSRSIASMEVGNARALFEHVFSY